MKKKQFKAESKKLLDLMIHSIYTNKEISIRELISNASDALDKAYFNSLTNKEMKIKKEDLKIQIFLDKDKKTITIKDNGCGMNKEELENNLGTIAESGSSLFKSQNQDENISIIGQFGVGFYSAFMIANKVTVKSKPYGSKEAYLWESEGNDGYIIEECKKKDYGTEIILTIKEDEEDEVYSDYLEEYKIRSIIKKYSNYIKYPIEMEVTKKELKEGSKEEYEEKTEMETLNSMIPIWKKKKSEVTDEEYDNFYTSTFYDYEKPFQVIDSHVEGLTEYDALLFIPSHSPFDLYTKDYKKGLQLYSNGVLIQEHCEELLPDYYSFVKGIVDSKDLPLNISRETLQQNKIIERIASNIEKKITSELKKLLENDREKYETFYRNFGLALKLGIYQSYGMKKDTLQDLLLFTSSKDLKFKTLKEYEYLDKQDKIYYVVGETNDKINLMPQVEAMKEKGYDILYLTDDIDEFVMNMMHEYNGKHFENILSSKLDIETEEEKKELEKINEEKKNLISTMKETLKNVVKDVKFTTSLSNHPVCLASEGQISAGMEKVLNTLPNGEKVKAEEVLMINAKHPIVKKLEGLKKEELEKYAKVLYNQARLIEGLSLDNPSEITDIICELLAK